MSLLQNRRFGRYLLYALGEILLVIIGILIALKINNLNEQNKNQERVEAFLIEVQRDLLADMEDLDDVIEMYEDKDSLIEFTLSETLTEEDYQRNPRLVMLLTTYAEFACKDNAYKNLVRNSDLIAPPYDGIIPKLDPIYLENKQTILQIQGEIKDLVSSTLKHWSKNYTWYLELNKTGYSREATQYFLTDPYYKNSLITLKLYASGNLLRLLNRQKILSVQAYQYIHEQLQSEEELPETVASYLSDLSPAAKEKWLGTFKTAQGFGVRIYEEDGTLQVLGNGQSAFALYPQSDSLLFNPVMRIQMELFIDSAEKVGFELLQNAQKIQFFKTAEEP